MLNGMTTVPGNPNIILSADSTAGEVVRFDLRTGVGDVAVSDPSFRLVPNTVPLGINGIEANSGYLYFTNSARGLFGRVKIDMLGNRQRTENVEILARLPQHLSLIYAYDDFVLITDCSGFRSAFIATQNNSLTQVDHSGFQLTILGGKDSHVLTSPTSVAITADHKKLYMTTGSSTEASLGGQVIELEI